MILLSSAHFYAKLTFHKNLLGTLSECQTVWTQIRTVLNWVKTVYTDNQKTTKVTASKERVKSKLDVLYGIKWNNSIYRGMKSLKT